MQAERELNQDHLSKGGLVFGQFSIVALTRPITHSPNITLLYTCHALLEGDRGS